MNILVICHYGMYQNLTYSFVHNQIREYAAMGHRVRVLIPNGIGKTGRDGSRIGKAVVVSVVDGVELVDLRYLTLSNYGDKGFNTASAIAAVRTHWKKVMGDFAPDVIHAHTLGFDSEIGAWLKEKFHCPLVLTTHGSDTEIPMRNGGAEMLRRTCDKADLVVAVSSKLMKTLSACGTKTPLSCVLDGFVFRGGGTEEEKRPYHMLQVSNLVPSKHVDVTIRALARLRETYPQMTLEIVGQGGQRDELASLCRELGVEDCVSFTGQVPNQTVFEKMQQASYFVMPSKPEGFGIVYLEAMSCRCVTIGTEGEGIADVIVSGENGFLVSADDTEAIAEGIASCIEDPDKAAAMAQRGYQSAMELTWSTNAKKYIDIFKELLQC